MFDYDLNFFQHKPLASNFQHQLILSSAFNPFYLVDERLFPISIGIPLGARVNIVVL